MLLKKQKRGGNYEMLGVDIIKTDKSLKVRQQSGDSDDKALTESIVANGIIQPLLVKKGENGNVTLICGNRRLSAAIKAGLDAVPCIVINAEDEQAVILSAIENTQRRELHFFEQARLIEKLMKQTGCTVYQAGKIMGLSPLQAQRKLNLLNLSILQQSRIVNAGLTEHHASCLLRIYGEDARESALDEMIAKGMDVSRAQEYVDKLLAPAPAVKSNNKLIVGDIRLFVNSINKAVDTMKFAGIKANLRKEQTDDCLRFVITIPKSSKEKKKQAFIESEKQLDLFDI